MTSVEYLGKYQLTQSDACFKLGRDSVLLAGFCTLRPKWTVCDLGCGVGSLLLLTAQREENLTRVGIELDPTAAALARKNLADNALSGDDPDRGPAGEKPAPAATSFTWSCPTRPISGRGPEDPAGRREWTTPVPFWISARRRGA